MLMKRLCTVMTGTHRDVIRIQNGCDIVRMHTINGKRQNSVVLSRIV